MTIRINKCRAFTLVETVVAMLLFGVMIAAIMKGFALVTFQTRLMRDNTAATQILTEKFETIRLYTWQQVHGTNVPATFTNGIFSGTITITDAPFACSYSANVCRMDVTVQWDTWNVHRTRTWTSYVAKQGLQGYIY